MEETVDYYSIGSSEDIVVSSSVLKSIDPEQGGNPVDFLNELDSGSAEESAAMRRGSLIHLWHEDKNNFQVAEVAKPSEKLGQIADKVVELIKLGGHGSDEDYEQAIREVEYYKNRWEKGMAKLIQDVKTSCDDYVYEFLNAKENNLIFMSAQDAEIIMNACQAIEKHPVANNLLFHQDNGIDNVQVFTEQEIFWEYIVSFSEDKKEIVKCKSKLDKIVVDFDKRVITIIDLKSTGRGVYHYNNNNFKNYRTYRQLGFYALAVSKWVREKFGKVEIPWKYEFKIVAVETTKTQQCVVYNVVSGWIKKGAKEVKDLLSRIATHQSTNQWSYSLEEVKNNYEINIDYEDSED